MYGYYWQYTIAQIELMVADCPIIVYKSNQKDKDGKKKASMHEVEKKAKEWENKYSNLTEKGIKLDMGNFDVK